MGWRQHQYREAGDVAEECQACGLPFCDAVRHDGLPCSGRYGHLDKQVLCDVATEDRYHRDRVVRYVNGVYGQLRDEVQVIACDWLRERVAAWS